MPLQGFTALPLEIALSRRCGGRRFVVLAVHNNAPIGVATFRRSAITCALR
jgi:hypothetical protein